MTEVKLVGTFLEEQGVAVGEMQSSKRQQIASKIASRFYELRDLRGQKYDFFRHRGFLEYVEDSLKRINQFKERPSHKKWWQANISGPTTRNKLIGILSKLAASAMEPRVLAKNEIDYAAKIKERVSNVFLKDSIIKNKDDKNLILEMFEAMAKGTVVGFEGWKIDRRMARMVTNEDPKTGELTFKEKEIKFWNDVVGVLVPLEDIYFGDIFVSDIQEMDDLIWRQVMKWDSFRNDFKDYEDADLVQPNRSPMGIGEDGEPIFYQQSNDIATDEVELLRYFNKATDEYVLIANGIWINPLGEDETNPLPFNHKKLPFWAVQFELIDAKFIYGKSLADKMISTQDMSDRMWDSILDRLTMALKAPIVIKGANNNLTEGYLEPDNVIEITDPIGNESVERLDLREPGEASFKMLEFLDKELQATSISAEVSGQGGQTTKTATQVQIEREGALELVSLFLRLMEFGIRDKYTLRLANIFQFYTFPSHKKDKDDRFKRIILRDEPINYQGKNTTGSLVVEFNPNPSQQRVEQESLMSPEPMEKMEITRDFIRNFEAEVTMVPRSSVRQSEALQQAQAMNFARMMLAMFPDKVNRDTLFQDVVAKYPDKDIRRLKAVEGQAQGGEMAELMGGVGEPPMKPAPAEPSLRELVG